MTLLTICQDAADRVGLPQPSQIIGNGDLNVRRLLAAANQEGIALSRRNDWQETQRMASFVTVSGQDKYPIESAAPNYGRSIEKTYWDQSLQRMVIGPTSPQTWMRVTTWRTTSVTFRYRIREGNVELFPTPGGAEEIRFEYITDTWCRSAGGTEQSRWLADDDTGILDEYLIGLGVEWRWLQINRRQYADLKKTYDDEVNKAAGRSGDAPDLQLAQGDYVLSPGYVPDGNWPG